MHNRACAFDPVLLGRRLPAERAEAAGDVPPHRDQPQVQLVVIRYWPQCFRNMHPRLLALSDRVDVARVASRRTFLKYSRLIVSLA
jgi:hypothetical protein